MVKLKTRIVTVLLICCSMSILTLIYFCLFAADLGDFNELEKHIGKYRLKQAVNLLSTDEKRRAISIKESQQHNQQNVIKKPKIEPSSLKSKSSTKNVINSVPKMKKKSSLPTTQKSLIDFAKQLGIDIQKQYLNTANFTNFIKTQSLELNQTVDKLMLIVAQLKSDLVIPQVLKKAKRTRKILSNKPISLNKAIRKAKDITKNASIADISLDQLSNNAHLPDLINAELLQPNEKRDSKLNVDKIASQADSWKKAASWIRARELWPAKTPELGLILNSLSTAPIHFADVARIGTQLKLLLHLENDQMVLFKPQRYRRDAVISGEPYAGFDRHNGEIAAFHLSRLLNFRYVPIVASRKILIGAEVKSVASTALLQTFVNENSSNCFYGECYYCSESDVVCPDSSDQLEGAIILMLPSHYTLQKLRSPWQRTYKDGVHAAWQMDLNYCSNYVKKKLPLKPRILDLIDASVFDYLIGNADRHHYEVFKDVPNSIVLFLDNGKSFGNSEVDEFTILAPLYQCCLVRSSTFERLILLSLSQNSTLYLSNILEDILSFDSLSPILSQSHLQALNRRLKFIIAVIMYCFEQHGKSNVIVNP